VPPVVTVPTLILPSPKSPISSDPVDKVAIHCVLVDEAQPFAVGVLARGRVRLPGRRPPVERRETLLHEQVLEGPW
jgi:hypothetical protein